MPCPAFDDANLEPTLLAWVLPVIPIEHLLLDAIEADALPWQAMRGLEHRLYPHCTKHTARQEGTDHWWRSLGHSARIFNLNWRLNDTVAPADAVLVTGFSCRWQTKRLAARRPRHPVEVSLDRHASTEA